MSDRATLNVDIEAAQALRRVVFNKHGTLRGGVVHDAATEAVLEWVERQEQEEA